MKNLYRVKFDHRFQGSSYWEDSSANVAADDALKAIAICKKRELKEVYEDSLASGKKVVRKCNGFRLTSIEHVARIDY